MKYDQSLLCAPTQLINLPNFNLYIYSNSYFIVELNHRIKKQSSPLQEDFSYKFCMFSKMRRCVVCKNLLPLSHTPNNYNGSILSNLEAQILKLHLVCNMFNVYCTKYPIEL